MCSNKVKYILQILSITDDMFEGKLSLLNISFFNKSSVFSESLSHIGSLAISLVYILYISVNSNG